MMLDMVAQVQVQDVPWSEVIVGLESHHKLEVLSNNVSSCRVRSNRKEGNKQKVDNSTTSPVFQDKQIERDDENSVQNDVWLCFSAEEN